MAGQKDFVFVFAVNISGDFFLPGSEYHFPAGITHGLGKCSSPGSCANYADFRHFHASFLLLVIIADDNKFQASEISPVPDQA
jgi:hypothetical protein